MTTFTSLKKNSGQKSLLELAKAAEKFNKKSGSSDGNFWKPTVDKAENGSAVIRFLPAHGDEDVAFVRYMDYSFKGPGGTYWEKSLKSLGKDDPVAELNSSLYNSTKDETSDAWEQARTQKRRVHYVANIYVISDPGKPENEGKVFLYDFGQKIWD